jgi:hypothetical protein
MISWIASHLVLSICFSNIYHWPTFACGVAATEAAIGSFKMLSSQHSEEHMPRSLSEDDWEATEEYIPMHTETDLLDLAMPNTISSDEEVSNPETDVAQMQPSSQVEPLHIPDVVQNSIDANIIFEQAARNQRANRIVMPWETGFAARVFNSSTVFSNSLLDHAPSIGLADFRMQVVMNDLPQPDVKKVVQPVLPFALRKLRLVRVPPDPDVLKQRAITMWRIIIEEDLAATRTGLILKQYCESIKHEGAIIQTLLDTFASKSPATLYKRGREMTLFLQWSKELNLHSVICFKEETVYRYVCYLRDCNSAPTQANSFVQAVRFTHTMLGSCGDPLSTVISSRVTGVAHSMFLRKRPLKQADPLSVNEVRALENAVFEATCEHDRIAAGFMLFCLMSSARSSDAQNCTNLRVERAEHVTILECDTLRHKTATSKEKQTTFLPYVTLGSVFQIRSWAETWMELRSACLVPDRQCLLPAPNFAGGWLNRKLSTGEVTLWLRDILVSQGCDRNDVMRLTSHSLKTTILSWAAKAGMSLQTRRILGHHVDPEARSALTYSRDAIISAQIEVYDMLLQIGANSFDPDLTRAQRLLQHHVKKHGQKLEESRSEELPVEPQDSDSSEDDVREVQEADADAHILWNLVDPDNSMPCFTEHNPLLYQHVVSGTVHIKNIALSDTLFCGRLITDNYRQVYRGDVITWPICGQCSKAHPLQ